MSALNFQTDKRGSPNTDDAKVIKQPVNMKEIDIHTRKEECVLMHTHLLYRMYFILVLVGMDNLVI